MKEKKRSEISVLLGYAGNYKRLTFLGMFLSAVAMVMGMLPYVCIWLAARDLIRVAPNWSEAKELTKYGWMAFGFSFGGILVYFAALMCTHLAAFRTAANIRKQGVAHMMKAPLGFFDNYGSGFLRNRLDGGAAETETLVAHNLADVVGTAAMFIVMIVLMFVFDWRMGAACLLAAVISVLAMFTMMGGKNAKLMMEYFLLYLLEKQEPISYNNVMGSRNHSLFLCLIGRRRKRDQRGIPHTLCALKGSDYHDLRRSCTNHFARQVSAF